MAMAARSFDYIIKLILILDVPKVYPLFPHCNHFSSPSRNMMNRNGMRVSPFIVPLWIAMGYVLLKCLPLMGL